MLECFYFMLLENNNMCIYLNNGSEKKVSETNTRNTYDQIMQLYSI